MHCTALIERKLNMTHTLIILSIFFFLSLDKFHIISMWLLFGYMLCRFAHKCKTIVMGKVFEKGFWHSIFCTKLQALTLMLYIRHEVCEIWHPFGEEKSKWMKRRETHKHTHTQSKKIKYF